MVTSPGGEEKFVVEITNPNNLPILEMKILVAGTEKSG